MKTHTHANMFAGSGLALAYVAGSADKENATLAPQQSQLSREPRFHNQNSAGALAASGLRSAILLVLLLMGAVFVAPKALYSQTAPALSFAGIETTVGASGLANPRGVAVDGSGDVFIADSLNARVVKVPAGGGAQTTVGSGLYLPIGVAVDGAGDVFIADAGNNVVVEVPAGGGAQITVGSGLSYPHGVAVDGAGDVFIADSGNNRVEEVPAGSGAQITVPASGLNYPTEVAVDGAGDLFIADSGNNRVVELPAGGGAQITVPASGLNNPNGVAADGAGDVFIADTGNNRVVEVLASDGAQATVGSGLNSPYGVTVNGTGDVFIADTLNNRAVEVNRIAVNFGSANVCPSGKTSPAPCSQTLTLTYNVTSGGTVGTVNVLTQGATALDFTLSSSTCAGELSAGSSCAVKVKFAPKAPGLRMGAVRLLYTSGETPTVLASTPIYGEGQGPAIAFDPSTQSKLGSELEYPFGVAVDAKGDVFIADSENDRVVEIPAGGAQITVPASGLNYPTGVAVDGAGDVFIADSNNNRVVEVPAGGGAQIRVGSGLSYPSGVAVDGAGDVFIADSNNNRVVEIPAGGGAQITVGSGLSYPSGVAVDGAGDVFVADSNNNRVVEVPAGGGSQITVGSGLYLPTGVAVDAAGDVFIADGPDYEVVEVAAGGGAQTTIGSGQYYPGVAVDGKGDVFIVDTNSDSVLEVHRSAAPTLSFVSAVGVANSQQVTVQNIGNQSLNAVAPGLTVGDAEFQQVPGSGTPPDCTSTFSLTAGASCNLSISFTPPTINSFASTAVLTDNALNATTAKQTIHLSGKGVALGTPVVKVAGGPLTYTGLGQSATCTATGTGGVAVSGSCTFTYNGSANEPINAGTYTVIASFTSTDPLYGNATGTGKLTIDKAPLAITANGAVFLQGGTFPQLTVSYAGFVDGQTQTVLAGTLKITTTATTTSAVGTYPIVPRGLTSTNYKITFVDGTLAVLPSTGLAGLYNIQNVNSALLLGVEGRSTSAGADIVQWTSDGATDQEWTLSLLANGAYQITDLNSGMVIGVSGASTSQGASLVQWPSNGSSNQQWQFTPSGSNWIITNVNSALVMAIGGNSTSAGAQVIQWPANGTASQVFTLITLAQE
jgi:large repetitive protein